MPHLQLPFGLDLKSPSTLFHFLNSPLEKSSFRNVLNNLHFDIKINIIFPYVKENNLTQRHREHIEVLLLFYTKHITRDTKH